MTTTEQQQAGPLETPVPGIRVPRAYGVAGRRMPGGPFVIGWKASGVKEGVVFREDPETGALSAVDEFYGVSIRPLSLFAYEKYAVFVSGTLRREAVSHQLSCAGPLGFFLNAEQVDELTRLRDEPGTLHTAMKALYAAARARRAAV